MTARDAERMRACVAAGGVALFPADTVYGLACSPTDPAAVRALYELKGREPARPAAVMTFELGAALRLVPELGPRTRAALSRLMPGPVTALVHDPAGRFPLAATEDPHTLGLRVPALPARLAALAAVGGPVLQSSANPSGAPDARRLQDVDPGIRDGADVVLDGGELPGTPSTVVDLRGYEAGRWEVVRPGALGVDAVAAALGA